MKLPKRLPADRPCDGCGCAYGRWEGGDVGHEGAALCNLCWMREAAHRELANVAPVVERGDVASGR